jgi:uncharacterized membrane protein HdeD (DUF308 family)
VNVDEGDGPHELSNALRRSSWLLAVVGLLSLVAGAIVVATPAISLVTLAVITGIWMLVDAAAHLVGVLLDRAEQRVVAALAGAVIGVLLIRHPIHGLVAVALALGLWLILSGMARLVEAIAQRRLSWLVLVAVVELTTGIVIVSDPRIGLTALALIVGIGLIVRGIAMVAIAWAAGHAARALAGPGPEERPSGAVPAT